jgi:DNA polymerase
MQELETYGRLILADIASVRPRLIGAGKIGGCTIRRSDARRAGPGRCFEFQGIPVRVTYHPAFVLRFGGRGSRLWRSTVFDLSSFWSEVQTSRNTTRSM